MTDLTIRRATPGDDEQILELAAASLGWVPDGLHREFFDWKHRHNPFGPSPMWVACSGKRVVGFRTFLRWEFLRAGETVRAVRAVDTATHPDFQGKGIFRNLTLHALEELREEGVAFVFNTPNDQSRAGYLKMGWVEVGRLPVSVRPRSVHALVRMARARVPAEMWSQPISGDRPTLNHVTWSATGDVYATRRSSEYLSWRYGFEPLAYRSVGEEGGNAVYRVRRRGASLEVAVVDTFGPREESSRAAARVVRHAAADYAIQAGQRLGGFLPLPRSLGPIVTWRGVCDNEAPSLHEFAFTLGDIELF